LSFPSLEVKMLPGLYFSGRPYRVPGC